jgi:phosphoribosylglycinamide formyltransferase-1
VLIGEEILQKSKAKIAIMASGKGTNARNLILSGKVIPNISVCCLISDVKDAPALQMAKELGVDSFYIPVEKKENLQKTKDFHESKVIALLKEHDVDWIFLAGYMRILGKTLLQAYHKRIVNIHPSLLPAFPGKNAYEDAFNYGVKLSGVTTHFVDEGIDTGKIILQDSFIRKNNDTLDDFKARGLELEHRLYSKTLEILAAGRLEV